MEGARAIVKIRQAACQGMTVISGRALAVALCCWCLMVSCQSRQGDRVADPVSDSPIPGRLALTDTFRIVVDSVTESSQYYTQVVTREKKYIIFNHNNNCLQAYSLVDGKYSWKICFDDGRDKIRGIKRFYYHNKDSIFFFEEYPYNQLKLFDSRARLVAKWPVSLSPPYDTYWTSLDRFCEFRYLPAAGTVIFTIYPEDYSQTDREFYRQARLCAYELESGEYAVFGGFADAFYRHDDLYYAFEYLEFYYKANQLVLWYHPVNEIKIYDLGNLQEKAHLRIPGQYFDGNTMPIMQYGEDMPDMQEESDYLLTAGYTALMLYDEASKYSYRIIKQPASLRYSDGRVRNFYDKEFSVIVMDADFNIIDEVKFPGGKFDFFQSFCFDNKLFISLNNQINENLSENYMQFGVFGLVHN